MMTSISESFTSSVASLLLLHSPSVSSLPSYQDPITLSPPLLPQLDDCCELSHRQIIISEASLSSNDQLWVEPYRYEQPASYDTNQDIERIILEFDGSISGVQYDRFGAVWVDGIELLRTTTPEPPGDGNGIISWSVERDVTDYASVLLKSEDEVYAAIAIPNTVNDEYTGVIHVNCTLSFYTSKGSRSSGHQSEKNRIAKMPAVMNLNKDFVKQLQPNSSSPMDHLRINTNTVQNYTLNRDDFPPIFLIQSASSHNNLGRVFLDVYASGHACEEFYYTNMPTSMIPTNSSSSTCGGGPIRLLQVKVNGHLAGVAVPFPTVYTGGINPMLWRPLTGIESFDVVPYRFELTPFVGMFHDVLIDEGSISSSQIEISLEMITGESVVGGKQLIHDGLWFLDATLILHPEYESTKTTTSYDSFRMLIHSQENTSIDNVPEASMHGCNVSFSDPYKISIAASSTKNGYSINITYDIDSFVTLLFPGEDSGDSVDGHSITYGTSKQKTTTRVTEGEQWLQRVSLSKYDIYGDMTNKADANTFDLGASIKWSRERFEEYTSSGLSADSGKTLHLNAHWVNGISASARYNRSLADHDKINIADGSSNETYIISSNTSNVVNECYKAEASAIDGDLVADRSEADGKSLVFDFDCHFPPNILFCGQELCGLIDFELNYWTNKDGKNKGESKSSENTASGHRALWLVLFAYVVLIAIACRVCWVPLRGKVQSLLDLCTQSRRANIGGIEQTSPS